MLTLYMKINLMNTKKNGQVTSKRQLSNRSILEKKIWFFINELYKI